MAISINSLMYSLNSLKINDMDIEVNRLADRDGYALLMRVPESTDPNYVLCRYTSRHDIIKMRASSSIISLVAKRFDRMRKILIARQINSRINLPK